MPEEPLIIFPLDFQTHICPLIKVSSRYNNVSLNSFKLVEKLSIVGFVNFFIASEYSEIQNCQKCYYFSFLLFFVVRFLPFYQNSSSIANFPVQEFSQKTSAGFVP